MSKNIFEHTYGDVVCYSRSVEDRLSCVNDCSDVTALGKALSTVGLQVTVAKAIRARIRKLEKGQVQHDRHNT